MVLIGMNCFCCSITNSHPTAKSDLGQCLSSSAYDLKLVQNMIITLQRQKIDIANQK